MAFRIGRCTNDLFCSFASSQQDLQVPAEGNFVCPQCGKALSNPPERSGGGAGRLAVVTAGSLAMAGVLLFLAGMMMGSRHTEPQAQASAGPVASVAKPQPPARAAKPAAGDAAQQASLAPAHATSAFGQTVSAAPAATAPSAAQPGRIVGTAPPTVQPAVTQAAPAQPSLTAQAQQQHAAPVATPPGPQTAPHPAIVVGPAPVKTVQLAMVQQTRPLPPATLPPATVQPAAPPQPHADAEQARRVQAEQAKKLQAEQAKRAQAEQTKRAEAEKAKRDEAEQAKRAQAEQVRRAQALAEKARQDEAAAAQKKADEQAAAERQRAQQLEAQKEAEARAAKPAPVAVAVAQPPAVKPAPSGPSRGFSTSPVAGGSPAYPAELETDGRSGSVTVSCRIQVDGHPAGCHAVAVRGGEPFKGAVLGWLNSGRVRYQPILRNGKPVTETHEWNVQFDPN